MAKLITTLRNNWKKSAFGTVALTYGVSYAKERYMIRQLMRDYCNEALQFGEAESYGKEFRKIVVVLNPVANRRKAKKNFEKYCAPLLHLAGIAVEIKQTEKEGHARNLLQNLDSSIDAVVVAGGDGTLSEAVTGLIRRTTEAGLDVRRYPVGVIPLGYTNSLATSLFAGSEDNPVKVICDATMAVIRDVRRPVDVMKIESVEEGSENPGKPIYALSGIQWGAFRDASSRKQKYWFWGSLRSYVSYVFTGLKSEKSGISWHCDADLKYILPCRGCSKCYAVQQQLTASKQNALGRRWWQSFIPKKREPDVVQQIDYSSIINDECGREYETNISTVDLALSTTDRNAKETDYGHPYMNLKIGPPEIGYFDFISEGWNRENGKEPHVSTVLQTREVYLKPHLDGDKKQENTNQWISIDNEDYEVKPIHITLLPNMVSMFCSS